jgi:glucan 1,3-beta-glucosidase
VRLFVFHEASLTFRQDDTVAVQNFLNAAAQAGQIAYFDHGAYIISGTIQVPVNLKITGELFPIIMATGPNFSNQNSPRPLFRVGNPGESGTVEISELVFETKGPAPGAIMVEWNIKATSPGAAGMWDSHWRIGGTAGTELQRCEYQAAILTFRSDEC